MELRPDANHKENVPPRPATPLRPEARRLLETQSLDVLLGPWVPRGQAERGGPATAPSPGTVLLQEPCRVQTNLASPGPRLGRALKATTGPDWLTRSSFRQQSNLQPLRNLSPGGARALAIQQSNLGIGEASLAECGIRSSPHLWSEPPESFWPHVMPPGSPLPRGPQAHPSSTPKQSQLRPTDTPCLDFRPTAHYAPVDGHTQPGPSSWGGLGNWTSGLMGEPLTLEDLAVPAKSQARAPCQARAPSQVAMSQLLASVQCLEHEVARLRCWGTQEPPVHSQQEPGTSNGQGLPACTQPCQPVLASRDKRKKHPHGLRGATNFPGTPGAQLGPSDSQAGSKPTSPPPGTTSEVLTGDFLNAKHGILPACALRQGKGRIQHGIEGVPLLPQGVGSRKARLCSPTFSRAAKVVLPGQEGGAEAPRQQVCRETSCLPVMASAGNALQEQSPKHCGPGVGNTSRQLLSRCFQAWRHSVQRGWAVVAVAVLGQQQLLCGGLQALRWALWLREARLEAVWSQHARALLAWSFQKWRTLTQQQKQSKPYIQAEPGPPPSGGGPSGRKPAVDPAQRSSPGSLKEEAGPWPSPSGPRPDGGDRRAQTLQALQQLAGESLPPVVPSEGMGQAGAEGGPERDLRGHAKHSEHEKGPPGLELSCSPSRYSLGGPTGPQHQRAWLRRCFGAWRQVVRRGAQYPDHLADHPMGTLRMYLKRKGYGPCSRRAPGCVGHTAPHQSLTENRDLCSSAPRGATSYGLGCCGWPRPRAAPGARPGLPAGSCSRLALQQVLLLGRVRLSQRQRVNHSQAWCGSARGAGTPGPGARPPERTEEKGVGVAFTAWWEARVATAWTQEHSTAWASVAHWRSHVLGGQAERQLRRTRAQQAFVARWVALGQHRAARQQAEETAQAQAQVTLSWTLWVPGSHLHQLSQAHAAQKLNARFLEALVHQLPRVVCSRLPSESQQVGHRHLLWTHWAQWRTALLRVWPELRMEAQETSTAHPRPKAELRHRPRLASRGCFLVPMDTAAPGQQTHSHRPRGMEPRLAGPTGPTQHHSLGGRRGEQRDALGSERQCSPALDAVAWTDPLGPGAHPCRTLEEQAQAQSSVLSEGALVPLPVRTHTGPLPHSQEEIPATLAPGGTAPLAAGLPAGPGPGSNAAALGRCLGAEKLAWSPLRQWPLRGAGRTWWRRVVQLQLARRFRQRDNGRVLSQVFEKRH